MDLLIPDWAGWLAALALLAALGAYHWRQVRWQRALLAAHAADTGKLEQRLRAAVRQAAARDGQLVQLLDILPDGAALLDRNDCLVAWNRRFPGLTGAQGTPRVGQTVAELLPLARPGDRRPEGSPLRRSAAGMCVEDGWAELADGGRLLTCRPRPDAPPAPQLGPELRAICERELRDRLPLLLEAAAAGKLSAAGDEAHAMRGVAANLGLAVLPDLLLAIERDAREGELLRLRQAAMGLPNQLDAALEGLARQAA